MLRWQRLKWLKILLWSILGHITVLLCLFVLYKDSSPYHIVVTGTQIDTDVPIVFMPMHKSLHQVHGLKGGAVSQGSARVAVSDEKMTTEIAAQKSAKGTTLGQPSSPRKKEKIKNKKKQVVKKKQELQKPVEPLRQASDSAKATPDKQDESFDRLRMNNSVCHDDKDLSAPARRSLGEGRVLYLGQQEIEALRMQDYIQQEMAQHWSPPPGMRKDLACTVKVMVAFDGAIHEIVLEKSSGVLVFDGAAKRAAQKLQPPQWAYGKEFLITFTP